jgi:hypothetical protein
VRGKMMRPGTYENVGEAQPVPIMINRMISLRTRTNNHTTVVGRAVGPALLPRGSGMHPIGQP